MHLVNRMVLVILCVLCGATAIAQAAPRTQKALEQQRFDLLKPMMLDPFLAEKGDEPWRADAQELIEAVMWTMKYTGLSTWVGSRTSHDEPRMLELACKVLDSDCQQPNALIAASWVIAGQKDLSLKTKYEPRMAQAWNFASNNTTPPLIGYLFVQRLRKGYPDGTEPSFLKNFSMDIDSYSLQMASIVLINKTFKPVDRDVCLSMVGEWAANRSGSERISETFCDELKANLSIDRYYANCMLGVYEYRLAWQARGSGFAPTVTEAGMGKFREHLDKSAKLLEEAYNLDNTMTTAAKEMITVSMGRSDAQGCDLWFNRAIAIQMDNTAAWEAYIHANRARWLGSNPKLLQIGLMAAKDRDFSTRTQWYLIQALRTIYGDGGINQVHDPRVMSEVSRIIAGYKQNLPPGFTPEALDTTEAAMGYILGDWSTCTKAIERAGDKADRSQFTRLDIDPDHARRKAAAMDSPWAARIKTIVDLSNTGRNQKALDTAKPLFNQQAPDEQTRRYAAFLVKSNQFLLSYESGKITPLLDTPDALTCWSVDRAGITPDEKGRITIKPGDKPVRMVFRIVQPSDFVYRGILRFDGVDPASFATTSMIIQGKLFQADADGTVGINRGKADSLLLNLPMPQLLAMDAIADLGQIQEENFKLEQQMDFQITVKASHLNMTINGKKAISDVPILDVCLVGFSCVSIDSSAKGSLTVENLTLQKLK